MFPIRRVERSAAESLEPLGSKQKYWFREGERRLLFKAEDRGTGEDWAEVISCHLCRLLALPHVEYELAEEWNDGQFTRPGVICENLAPPPKSLALGNQMLAILYDPAYPATQRFHVRQHSVQAIRDVLFSLALPPGEFMFGCPVGIQSAEGVFVGYLMLDAWIANQDRHHENWAAVFDDFLRLAPTYDHGAALARNLLDEERTERLETKDRGRSIATFAARARSAIYRDATTTRPLTTLEAFAIFAAAAPDFAAIWQQQLASVTEANIQEILDQVPDRRMSKVAKEFTMELLRINKQRVLSEVNV